MKKFLSVLLTVLLLLSCLSIPALADGKGEITLTEDYQKLYYNGKSYSRVNLSMLDINFGPMTITAEVILPPSQQEAIQEVEVSTPTTGHIILWVYISFKDGSSLSIDFLQDDYREKYDQLIKGNPEKYTVDFAWPVGSTVTVDPAVMTGNAAITLSKVELRNYDHYFPVYASCCNADLQMISGCMFIIDEQRYYMDTAENGIPKLDLHSFSPSYYGPLKAHPITDSAAIEQFKAAERAYYSDDFGFFEDTSIMEAIAFIFLTLLFGLVPLAVLVLTLILAIRNKGTYRKLFLTTCILSLVTLLFFIGITLFINMYGGM